MAPPPNAFCNELDEWIWKEFTGSIVMIEFRPVDAVAVNDRWNKFDPIPSDDDDKIRERKRLSADYSCSTGFIMHDDGKYIWVLTCAHALGPIFNNEKPITISEVAELFKPVVLCDHQEERYRRTLGSTSRPSERMYVKANVSQISCQMDLMLLTIPKVRFAKYCGHPHRIISMAEKYPSPLQKVAMLSWPMLRNRTAVTGVASHPGRLMESVSCTNPFGFRMRIAEVSITSEAGSSGAPLLNGAGEFVSVLHGGCGTGFSHFISLTDIRDTLRQWGAFD